MEITKLKSFEIHTLHYFIQACPYKAKKFRGNQVPHIPRDLRTVTVLENAESETENIYGTLV